MAQLLFVIKHFAARQLAADTINDLVEDFFNKLAQGAVP
jgi:hypothetical protein